jgi:hypothetical protein
MDILLVECGATGSADVQLRLPKKLAKNFRFVSFCGDFARRLRKPRITVGSRCVGVGADRFPDGIRDAHP